MKKITTIFIFIFSLHLFGQSNMERYSTVGITLDDYQQLIADKSHGLAIDHFHKNESKLYEFVFSESEIIQLTERGITPKVIIEDYKAHFRNLASAQKGTRSISCGLDNFDNGDMGGYHTYSQVVDHIAAMEDLYGEIVSTSVIGQSIEGRDIWVVKISDNPELDESDKEGVVYFEALTHAREPMSLEATLYYMWWLLEHSTSDEEAMYLINNREIYFVPIVNPDGYVYNETTDPNGGGLWRKNRLDAGNNCFGVDLNRNYPKGWGLNSGSSNNPCSNTYRGESPFSEPETQAIANFIAQIEPSIAFSSHTYGDKFLSPWGYVDSLASYDLYAEFVSEFIPSTYDGYGTTAKMLNYTSSGTTRDYFHTEDILAWVPEIGHSFWENPAFICDRVQEFLKPMQYITWVSGDYACFHDFTLVNDCIWTGDTIALDIRLKNRGLTHAATSTEVKITPMHTSITALNNQESYGTIEARQFGESVDAPFRFEAVGDFVLGEEIPFIVEVYSNGVLTYSREIFLIAGAEKILYSTDFEMDNDWLLSEMGWDTSFMDATSGFHCLTDSRFGNYLPNSSSLVILEQPFDFTEVNLPFVSFNTKWALEPDDDYVQFVASTNSMRDWVALPGLFTDHLDRYTQNSHWLQERVDLSQFKGESEIYFAFLLESDGSVHSDGIYIDDFKLSDYSSPLSVSTEHPELQVSPISLFPNPATSESTLTINSIEAVSAKLQILSLNGQVQSNRALDLNQGINKIRLDLNSFLSGIYIVQLSTERGFDQVKLVIR